MISECDCRVRLCMIFCFQAEDGIRDLVRSRGLGDVYKRQGVKRQHPIRCAVRKDKRRGRVRRVNIDDRPVVMVPGIREDEHGVKSDQAPEQNQPVARQPVVVVCITHDKQKEQQRRRCTANHIELIHQELSLIHI